jgi:hypothetical protein
MPGYKRRRLSGSTAARTPVAGSLGARRGAYPGALVSNWHKQAAWEPVYKSDSTGNKCTDKSVTW